MCRASRWFGVLLCALIACMLAWMYQDVLTPPSLLRSLALGITPPADQPIPAMASTTLEVPLWALYFCAGICIFVATVMLCRCHVAAQSVRRKPYSRFRE